MFLNLNEWQDFWKGVLFLNINDARGPCLNRIPILCNSCGQTGHCKPDDIGEGREGWPRALQRHCSSVPGASAALCHTRSPSIHPWSSPLAFGMSLRTTFSNNVLQFFHFTRRCLINKKFKLSLKIKHQAFVVSNRQIFHGEKSCETYPVSIGWYPVPGDHVKLTFRLWGCPYTREWAQNFRQWEC